MPANRPHVDRDAKAAEILDAAEVLLLSDGYEAMTMASVARAAGISSNAVYWYFPSKDELLAAVLMYAGFRMAGASSPARNPVQHAAAGTD